MAELLDGRLRPVGDARGPRGARVVGRIAGARRRALGSAEAIASRAPLPESDDAVVPQEDVVADGARIVVSQRVERDAFVRRPWDVRAGVVVGPGTSWVLPSRTPGDARYARVRSAAAVAILSTGNELADLGVERDRPDPEHQHVLLMAQVLEAGGEPVSLASSPPFPSDCRAPLGPRG